MTEQKNISDKCTFELLSAYLDGEVTASEREEVQHLLRSDLEIQQLYRRLQLLREGCQKLPTPEPEYSPEDLAHRVFAHIDQERKTRKRWLWAGGAIAAMLIAGLGTIFSPPNRSILQFAEQEETESLIIAFGQPLIEIPTDQQLVESESLMIPIDHSLIEIPQQ